MAQTYTTSTATLGRAIRGIGRAGCFVSRCGNTVTATSRTDRDAVTHLVQRYAQMYIRYGRVAAQNYKAALSLPANLCRLALQLEATSRNEKKGHILILD